MPTAPTLTNAQWEIVVEVLRRERRELPSELHHAQTSSVRDGLRRRIKEVDGILDILGSPVVVDPYR